jgi:hypothetical protein
MVYTSTLTVATDGERLTCDDFSLGKTIRFGSIEFIINCFSSLSLPPKGSDSGTIFVRTTRNGSSSLRAMVENSIDEFYTTFSGEGSSDLPVPWKRFMGAPSAPIATTP